MNTSIIEKRFEELVNRTAEVDKTIIDVGYGQLKVDREQFVTWATSCLALLSQVFGEDSTHYKYFNKQYESFDGFLAGYYISCKGVFKAAFEDYNGGYIFKLRGLITSGYYG